MLIQDVINILEDYAPLDYAEDFDNVGLLVGSKEQRLTGILVTLDTLESVVDEAIENKCNLIVSFHPIIFSGLKKITGKTYVERTILKAIKNDIAIYAIHTALDNAKLGVNNMICESLGLVNRRILIPKSQTIKKLTTYVPKEEAENLRSELFKVGAGYIGNYSNCSFNVDGTGTFKGNTESNPTKGEKGETHFEDEVQVSMIFNKDLESIVLKTLFEKHSYEEVAYEIVTLENKNQNIGMGMIGELPKALDVNSFLSDVKQTFNCKIIRHTELIKDSVKNIAVLGGSGSFVIHDAMRSGADVLITSDLKYHDFFKAEKKLILADIGHYESERFTKNLIVSFLTKKITNFAIILSKTNKNPIKYF